MDVDIVVMNLVRSLERRSRMADRLDELGLSYRFFEAVDGKETSHDLFARYDEKLAEIRRGFPLTRGELGCYASHYLLWQDCVASNRAVLILEDDIEIRDNFTHAIQMASNKLQKYGLIRFSAHKRRSYAVVEQLMDNCSIIRFKLGPHGGSAYAVTPDAARKLIYNARVWFEPVDCHLDRFWTHGVGSYCITPVPVSHVDWSPQQSEIWQGENREKKSRRFRKLRALYRAKDDIGRFIYNMPLIGKWMPPSKEI